MMQSYSGHGTGGAGGVDYPEEEETARVLLGDKQTCKELIKNNSNKRKYRSGIITFEEKNPSPEVVQDVIDNFVKHTFAGLDQEQYHCYMVEHTNTDKYHIHFYIPRLELTNGKAYNPHWHKQDQTLLLKFQDYMNAKHGLSSPWQKEKAKTLRNIDTKSPKHEVKREINKVVEAKIAEGVLKNREDIIDFFKESGVDVIRTPAKSVTIQFKGEKHRMEGIYYEKTFTDIEAVGRELERAEREHIPASQREFEKLEREFNRLVEYKAKRNREKYPNLEQDSTRKYRLRVGDVKDEQDLQVHRDSSNQLDYRLTSDYLDSKKLSLSASGSKERRRDNTYVEKEKINDTIRANASRRARERERAEQLSLKAVKAEPSGVYRRVAKNFNSVREYHEEDKERLRVPAGELEQEVRGLHEQRSGGIFSIQERIGEVIQQAKEYISNKVAEVARKFEEMKAQEKAKEVEEVAVEEVEQEEEYVYQAPTRSPFRLR